MTFDTNTNSDKELKLIKLQLLSKWAISEKCRHGVGRINQPFLHPSHQGANYSKLGLIYNLFIDYSNLQHD
jgi:hypothetical protein